MKRDCGEIRDLLDLYVAGSLSPEKRTLVEDHLEECGACRRDLALSRALSFISVTAEERGQGYHLTTETLSELVFTPELLDESVREGALEHLTCCKRCAEDYETLKAVLNEVEAGEDRVKAPSIWAKLGQVASGLLRRRVPAWVAVACAVLAVFVITRGDFLTPDRVDRSPAFVVSEGVVFDPAPDLTPTRPMQHRAGRGEDLFPDVPVTEVTLESLEFPTSIAIERPDVLTGAESADIDLYSLAEGYPAPVVSWRGMSIPDGSASIPIPMPTGILQEGQYLLVASPIPAPPNSDQPAIFYRIKVHVRPPSGVSE